MELRRCKVCSTYFVTDKCYFCKSDQFIVRATGSMERIITNFSYLLTTVTADNQLAYREGLKGRMVKTRKVEYPLALYQYRVTGEPPKDIVIDNFLLKDKLDIFKDNLGLSHSGRDIWIPKLGMIHYAKHIRYRHASKFYSEPFIQIGKIGYSLKHKIKAPWMFIREIKSVIKEEVGINLLSKVGFKKLDCLLTHKPVWISIKARLCKLVEHRFILHPKILGYLSLALNSKKITYKQFKQYYQSDMLLSSANLTANEQQVEFDKELDTLLSSCMRIVRTEREGKT